MKKHSMDVYCGCSSEEMIRWIESQFEPWMSWDNLGHGKDCWSIDHIRPLSSFQGTQEQAMCAWNYRNLRPLDFLKNIGEKRERYTTADERRWAQMMRDHGYQGELFLLFTADDQEAA